MECLGLKEDGMGRGGVSACQYKCWDDSSPQRRSTSTVLDSTELTTSNYHQYEVHCKYRNVFKIIKYEGPGEHKQTTFCLCLALLHKYKVRKLLCW
jgi:hypothetical protein